MVIMLIGLIPIPLPGGLDFNLGLAGGPLIAGLVLGKVGRTGPLVWYLPYNANLLLRLLGLVLFFSGVGTRAGYAFFETLMAGGMGITILAAGPHHVHDGLHGALHRLQATRDPDDAPRRHGRGLAHAASRP